MKRSVFAVAMSLAMVAGALSVTGLTFLLDQVTFRTYDQFRDEDGNVPAALWDRYLTQAVESYVLGAAFGTLIALGLGFIVLGVWLRGIDSRRGRGGNGRRGGAL